MTDLITRLRTWSHARHAAPASDLMDEAADEIERLRLELSDAGKSNHLETPDSSTLTDAEREAIISAIDCCEDITYGGAADQEAADVLKALMARLSPPET